MMEMLKDHCNCVQKYPYSVTMRTEALGGI